MDELKGFREEHGDYSHQIQGDYFYDVLHVLMAEVSVEKEQAFCVGRGRFAQIGRFIGVRYRWWTYEDITYSVDAYRRRA